MLDARFKWLTSDCWAYPCKLNCYCTGGFFLQIYSARWTYTLHDARRRQKIWRGQVGQLGSGRNWRVGHGDVCGQRRAVLNIHVEHFSRLWQIGVRKFSFARCRGFRRTLWCATSRCCTVGWTCWGICNTNREVLNTSRDMASNSTTLIFRYRIKSGSTKAR